NHLLGALLANGARGITVTGINVNGHDLIRTWDDTGGAAVELHGDPPERVCSTGVFVNNNSTYGLGQYGIVLSTGDAADYSSGTSTFNDGSGLSTNFGGPQDPSEATVTQYSELIAIQGGTGYR